MRIRIGIAAIAGLVAAIPAAAQERETSFQQFSFIGHDLLVEVVSPMAGELHLIRGEPGLIRVRSASRGGLTAAGLEDEKDHLMLTTAGTDQAIYLVVVPEEAYVRIALPGVPVSETFGSNENSAIFRWGERRDALIQGPPQPASSMLYASTATPVEVSIPRDGFVGRVTVVQSDERFQVVGSRPLGLIPGNADRLEIRPTSGTIDITILVPRSAAAFTLTADGEPIVRMNDGAPVALCSGMTAMTTRAGARAVSFRADRGGLGCTAPQPPRIVASEHATR